MFDFLKPYWLYIKLAALAAVVVSAAWGAWYVRDLIAEDEVRDATVDANREAQKAIDIERGTRNEHQQEVDKRVEDLGKQLAGLRGEFSSIRRSLAEDMKANPDPYVAPVPAKGYESWMKARERARESSQP